MKIVVASKNPVKVQAVKDAFKARFPGAALILEAVSVESGVGDQPMSDQETRQGAYNRVSHSRQAVPDADFWVGLEGGLEIIDDEMMASAWMVIESADGKTGEARTPTLPLPPEVQQLVHSGLELGEANDRVFSTLNSKQGGGAFGLLTDGLYTRGGVVISGAGDSFCAGIDIGSLGAMVGKDIEGLIMPRTHGGGTTNLWQEVAMVWHRLEIPVVAALHGAVFGAGMQLALAADIRIAAPDAKLAVMEMKWGIIPDMGGMVLLPRLVGSDVLRRMTYTATPVDAEQALAWGLVTELADDPRAAAMALATEIAGKGPNAIRAAKRLINIAETRAPHDVLLAESREQVRLLGQPEQMEVIAAQFAKRAPVFE